MIVQAGIAFFGMAGLDIIFARYVAGQPTGVYNAIEHPDKPSRRVR